MVRRTQLLTQRLMSTAKARLSEKRKSLEELFLFQNTYWNLIKKIEEDVDLDVFDLEDVKYEDLESLIRMFALKVFHGDYDGGNPRFLAPSRRVNSLWSKFILSTGNYAKFCDYITDGDTVMIGRDQVIFNPESEAVRRTREAFKTQFIDIIDLTNNQQVASHVTPHVDTKRNEIVNVDDDDDNDSTETEREETPRVSSPVPLDITSSPLQESDRFITEQQSNVERQEEQEQQR